MCEAQQNFAKSTQVLENRRAIRFLRYYQAGTIAISKSGDQNGGRNGEDRRQDLQRVDVDVPPTKLQKDQPQCQKKTRMMAAYMYCVLYEQITGIRASQTGCAMDFKCPTTPFKRLITGKRQPGEPGRLSEARGESSRSLEEMEGAPLAKRTRKATKSAAAAKATPKGRGVKNK